MNGSVGEAQSGTWSGFDVELKKGGVLHNGGINNATKHDVEVVEAFIGKTDHHSRMDRRPEAGHCTIM